MSHYPKINGINKTNSLLSIRASQLLRKMGLECRVSYGTVPLEQKGFLALVPIMAARRCEA